MNKLFAENTRDLYVRTNSFMALNVFAKALSSTKWVSYAFYFVELADLVVGRYLLVLKDLGATGQVVAAFELHFR